MDPPLRMTFLHPGRAISIAETHGNISNFLAARGMRLPELNAQGGGGEDGEDGSGMGASDSITAPLRRLNNSLRETAERVLMSRILRDAKGCCVPPVGHWRVSHLCISRWCVSCWCVSRCCCGIISMALEEVQRREREA